MRLPTHALGHQLGQLRRDVDDPLRPELRRDELGRRVGLPLHLVTDGKGAAEEVDVPEPEAGRLPEP